MNHLFDRADVIKYISGKMSANDMAAFERAVAHDEHLAKQLAFYQNIDVHIDEVQQTELEDNLAQVSKDLEWESLEELKPSSKQQPKNLTVAPKSQLISFKQVVLGSVILLVALFVGYYVFATV